ncbi:hypothetical protein B0H14DRAFT_2628216 [Mycena olivaceomarginata]|nr:hypothetical protein B0H14DRAFT_2628216 [Mycena olivaceomarginata]
MSCFAKAQDQDTLLVPFFLLTMARHNFFLAPTLGRATRSLSRLHPYLLRIILPENGQHSVDSSNLSPKYCASASQQSDQKKPRKLSALQANTTASKPKKKGPAARGNDAPVNDTSTQEAPLAPVKNGEQNEDLTVFSRLLRLCDPNPGCSRVPSSPTSRETLWIYICTAAKCPRLACKCGLLLTRTKLEDLVKGREDRDEDELPDSPHEDVEEEDWDIDLPAQDAAGALEATYTMQYGFDNYTGLAYDDDNSPRLRVRSLQSPPRAHSLSATPICSPHAPDVDATGCATRPSLLCKESTHESEHKRGPAVSSGDDYATGVEKKSCAWTQVLKYGGCVSPTTSDEDADDDQAMTDEGEMLPVGQPNAKPKPKPKPKPQAKGRAKGKGKGKAKAPELDVVEGDGTGSDRAGSDDEDEDEGHTHGPLSAEVRASLEVIQENVLTTIDDLAKGCGKPSQTLHRALGTTPKVERTPSAWNIWQKWWADEEDAKNLPHGQFAKAAHAALKAKSSPMAARVERHYECTGSGRHPEQGEIEAEVALTQISKQLYNSYKVHCWGYVIDTQGDSSFVFGEGDDFKEMRQTQLHNLAQQMKDQEHMFGTIEMRKRGIQAQTVPSKTLVMQDNEKLRDLN